MRPRGDRPPAAWRIALPPVRGRCAAGHGHRHRQAGSRRATRRTPRAHRHAGLHRMRDWQVWLCLPADMPDWLRSESRFVSAKMAFPDGAGVSRATEARADGYRSATGRREARQMHERGAGAETARLITRQVLSGWARRLSRAGRQRVRCPGGAGGRVSPPASRTGGGRRAGAGELACCPPLLRTGEEVDGGQGDGGGH